MKKLFTILALVFFGLSVSAQYPVTWTYSAKKIADKKYEIQLVANMLPGWYLYSQKQPDDFIAIPTTFQFIKNPLVSFEGELKEIGKMEKFRDAKLDISANQYTKTVKFVQVVKLKSNVKTNLTGSVEFQTCDDKKCLPPKTNNFTIALN